MRNMNPSTTFFSAELGGGKHVVVNLYQGNEYVHIRYYEINKEGRIYPTKKV